jgi:hypothetical protein
MIRWVERSPVLGVKGDRIAVFVAGMSQVSETLDLRSGTTLELEYDEDRVI